MTSSLLVQSHLRSGGTTDQLKEAYGITAKRHRAHPNLVLLKYDQFASPFGERIVRECRGIVLDESRNWSVVSRAFDKFFNHGEGHAEPIDWASARVQEKLDGSLAVLYSYGGEWHVATSGTPDASGDVHGGSLDFKSYFWQTFAGYGTSLPRVDRSRCFYFELTGPLNRVVVVHAEPGLTLLGARDLFTQQEVAPHDVFEMPEIPRVRSYPLGSFEGILASFEAISPLSQEGYVVVDGAFRRVKVKHPGYIALHHAKDGMGPKAFLEIARSGESSEVLVAFPEFRPLLDPARARIDVLVAGIEADYERIRHIPVQKDFAQEALKTRCSSALFMLRSKKAESARAFVRGLPIDRLEDVLQAWEGVIG